MPFERLVPHPFTSNAIRMYAPAVSGVYGISNALEWLYIGEAGDIQTALLAHLRDDHAPLMKRAPTGFVYEVCDDARRPPRQNRLVIEYGPTCNGPAARHS